MTSKTLALRDYQLVARDFLRGRGRAALFLDMGLGKTASTLAALEPHHLPALVLAPKKVAEEVWDVEKDLWRPDLTLAVAAGSPAERARQIGGDADIVTLGYNNIADALKTRRFNTIIFDEISKLKGRGAWWKTARRMVKDVEYVWGLTGTPSPNGLLDLWPQVFLLDGGERLGRNITTYRSRFFMPGRQLPNGTIIEWNIREGAEAKIHGLIEDICLAMATEGRVHLPEFTVNRYPVHLPKKSLDAYRAMEDDLIVDLRTIFGGEVHSAANAAALTSKLSQIAAGFMYEDAVYEDTGEVDEYGDPILTHVNKGAFTAMNTAKVDALAEIREAQDSPLLVAYRFQVEERMILERFPDARTIDSPGVIKDWNAGKVPMLVAHPQSAGHGLNLQHGGHTIVWTSADWDLELWNQFNKRLLRSGQTHPVVAHVLTAEIPGSTSIDDLIAARLVDKAVVENDLLAYLESPI